MHVRMVVALLTGLASTAGAQDVVYRNVPIPKADAGAMGIEFTLSFADDTTAKTLP